MLRLSYLLGVEKEWFDVLASYQEIRRLGILSKNPSPTLNWKLSTKGLSGKDTKTSRLQDVITALVCSGYRITLWLRRLPRQNSKECPAF